MADLTSFHRPLTRETVQKAHERIKPHVHLTPVIQCSTLSRFASTPQDAATLKGTDIEAQAPAKPRMNLFFKCENLQRVGAFKARGAFHALSRLSDADVERGVITHSSGISTPARLTSYSSIRILRRYGG